MAEEAVASEDADVEVEHLMELPPTRTRNEAPVIGPP